MQTLETNSPFIYSIFASAQNSIRLIAYTNRLKLRTFEKMYFCTFLILLGTSALLYLYWYFKKSYSFFEKHGIPYIKPTFVFGNIKDVIFLRKSMAEFYGDMYKKLNPHRVAGIYVGTKPMVLIRDPDLLKDILIKDFANFSDRGWHLDTKFEPLSNNLFIMKGDDWKNLRMKLSGAFTGVKMRTLFPMVNSCAEKLSEIIDKTPKTSSESIDIKDLSTKYMVDVIGCCVLGLNANALDDPNSEFTILGKGIMEFRYRTLIRMLQIHVPFKLNRLLEITFAKMKIQNIFGKIANEAIEYRENQNIPQNDLLDLMIALKKNNNHVANQEKPKNSSNQSGDHKQGKNDLKITNDLLAAQAFIFFFAALANSSTNLNYVLMELSMNKSVQEKVRKEILDVLSNNDGNLTYDVLNQMTYTDLVIQETLRKYPSPAILLRKTLKNYHVPDSDIIIPAGTSIVVSLLGLHYDEKYYENPQQFCPERFIPEEISKRPNYTYLPFGEGPRHCIGLRFAKMTVKVGLIHALKQFSYRISPEMAFPIEVDKNFGLLTPCSSILLQREKLNE